jgi:nucleoside 2-deoxyribosyltransferase
LHNHRPGPALPPPTNHGAKELKMDQWCEVPRVYLAGRIEYSRGRFGVVGCSLYSGDNYMGAGREAYQPDVAPIVRFDLEGYPLEYVGPWTLSNDHGSCHKKRAPKKVGFFEAQERDDNRDCYGTRTHGSGNDYEMRGDPSAAILARALDGIRKCDLFFAWVADEQCFGTLAEIGYAKALGKVIVIATPPGFDMQGELWFSLRMADCYVFAPTAKEALVMLAPKVEGLTRAARRLRHMLHAAKEMESAR